MNSQEITREIIKTQDYEYKKSLEEDIKKEYEKKKKQEEELINIENRINIEENIKSKKKKLLKIKGGKEIKIRFQLPNKTIDYSFKENNTIRDLYDYIYTLDIFEKFKIYNSNPIYELKKENKSLLKKSTIPN